jgi:hypothetical protein
MSLSSMAVCIRLAEKSILRVRTIKAMLLCLIWIIPRLSSQLGEILFGMLVLRFGRGVKLKLLWEESNNFAITKMPDLAPLYSSCQVAYRVSLRYSHQDSNHFLFYFVFFITHIHNEGTNDNKNQSNTSLIVAIHLFFYSTPCLTLII